MILQEKYQLNSGINIPKVGFGTWMIDDEAVVQAVQDALEIGYVISIPHKHMKMSVGSVKPYGLLELNVLKFF